MKSPLIPSQVLAMIFFLFTEVMLFTALFSAYWIVSESYQNWPPLGQPRLPIETTAFNTLALLASGVCFWRAYQFFKANRTESVKWFCATIILGAFFVCFQGFEWLRLISYGLTLKSSVFGSFFYLIIGVHGLHAVAALLVLLVMFSRLKAGRLKLATLQSTVWLWLFVVGIWPLLYVSVYLN